MERFLLAGGRVEVLTKGDEVWIALNHQFDEKGTVMQCITVHMSPSGVILTNNKGERYYLPSQS